MTENENKKYELNYKDILEYLGYLFSLPISKTETIRLLERIINMCVSGDKFSENDPDFNNTAALYQNARKIIVKRFAIDIQGKTVSVVQVNNGPLQALHSEEEINSKTNTIIFVCKNMLKSSGYIE